MTEHKFLGYHDDYQIPFNKGDNVVIPKGAVILSTHPQNSFSINGKSRSVKIDHILPGINIRAIEFIPNYFKNFHNRDSNSFYRYRSLVNLSENELLITMAYLAVNVEKTRKNIDNNLYLSEDILRDKYEIPTQNPSVVWAGSGGYWCETDINTVIKANPDHPKVKNFVFKPNEERYGMKTLDLEVIFKDIIQPLLSDDFYFELTSDIYNHRNIFHYGNSTEIINAIMENKEPEPPAGFGM